MNEWDIYRYASCDYKWEVFDLAHEYYTSSHYSGSRACSRTYPAILKYHK